MFSSTVLDLDPEAETARIVEAIRAQVLGTLRKRGAVVGLSGGVDSSVAGSSGKILFERSKGYEDIRIVQNEAGEGRVVLGRRAKIQA